MSTEERLLKLLEAKFAEEDYADCFLIEIKISAAKKVEVSIDCDGRLDFAKCQRISRYLEGFIDEEGWLGEKYTLEVSSPGVDRPLKFKRQYVKNIGRQLLLRLQDGEEQTGLLKAVNEDDIIIEQKVRKQEGKRKKTVLEETAFAFDDITTATVKISFSK